MGGFFGVASKKDCVLELFYGVDYHSHLGTRRAGVAAFDYEISAEDLIEGKYLLVQRGKKNYFLITVE